MAEEVDYETLRAENNRLRHTLFLMVTDRKKMASKLTGVQNLGLQLQKRELENKTLREKVGRLELSLAITANRITQLSLQAGSSQHSGGQTAIVTPGVSKKVLEALARENTRLEQALAPVRVDLTVESATSEEVELKEEIEKLTNEYKAKVAETEQLTAELYRVKEEFAASKEIYTAQHQSFKEEQARMVQQVHVLGDELTAIKRDCDEKEIHLKDQEMERELMLGALAGYENVFKIERQEKVKALSDRDQASRERDQIIQLYEHLKQEHIGLRQNIEQMYSEAQKHGQVPLMRQTSDHTCGTPIQETLEQQHLLRPRGLGGQEVFAADGPGPNVPNFPTTPPNNAPLLQRHTSCQRSQLHCPNCNHTSSLKIVIQ